MGADVSKLASPRHEAGRSKYHDKLPNGKNTSEIMKEYRNAVPKEELNPEPKTETKGEQLLKMRAEEIRIERENKLKEYESKTNGTESHKSSNTEQKERRKRRSDAAKEIATDKHTSPKNERNRRRKDRSPENRKNNSNKNHRERSKDKSSESRDKNKNKSRDQDKKEQRERNRKNDRSFGKEDNKVRSPDRKEKSNKTEKRKKEYNDNQKHENNNHTKDYKSKEEKRRHRSKNDDESTERESFKKKERKSRRERSRSRDRNSKSRSNSVRSSHDKYREKDNDVIKKDNDVGHSKKHRERSRHRSHRDDVDGDVISRDTRSPRDQKTKVNESKVDHLPKTHEKSSKKKPKITENSPTDNINKKSRRKNKSKLKEKRSLHRSAPDLTDINNSKVGAWLNSAPTWQSGASPPPWGYPMPMVNYPVGQFGSLPRDVGRVPDVPRQIVDGFGNPVAQVYPVDPNIVMSPSYDMSQFQAMHPYFSMPYAYMYAMQNPYTQAMDKNFEEGKHNRSKSTDDLRVEIRKNRQKSSHKKKPSDSQLPVSPGNSQQSPYFSDIVETQNFITEAVNFQANRTISVDDVIHAEFKVPDQSEHDTSHITESTSSHSSSNDVTIDIEEVENFRVKSSTQKAKRESAASPTSDVKIFQPKSSREVFIDSTPKEDLKEMTSTSTSQNSTLTSTTENSFQLSSQKDDKSEISKSASSKPATIMRLCDRESIVATSFMAEGGKVFCIKRSKSEIVPEAEFKPKTSSVENNPKSLETVQKSEPEGMWFGITASPTKVSQPIKSLARNTPGKPSTNHLAQIKPQNHLTNMRVQPTNREPRLKPRDPPIKHVDPPMPKSMENFFKYPQNETKFIDTYRQASLLANSKLKPELVQPVQAIVSSTQKSFPVTSFNAVSFPNHKPKTPSTSSNDSDDSNVFNVVHDDRSPSLAKKLVRIDSHDSFTMKRRFKHLRKQSSGSGSHFERRATIGSISQSEFSQIQSPSTPDIRRSVDSHLNPFNAPPTPGIESYLYRAKSEEALRLNLSKSTEELLTEAPAARKETLQERAARILGLTNDDLDKAKQKKAEISASTSVTPSKAALGNISHASESPRLRKATGKSTESESFAVSVTDSMLAKLPETFTVKVLDTESSGDDASTLSNDDDDRSSISEQYLSNTTTEASLKEYKIPTNLLNQSASSEASVGSHRLGQEDIVASYTNSIYDKLPPDALRHSREYSDDTTESESVQSPVRNDFQQKDLVQPDHSRVLESPVPIASHSAPLTSGELDIIMQLYNSADESPSTSYSREPYTYNAPKSYTSNNNNLSRNELRKQQIAQAIGLDVNNIGRGEPPSRNLEKVEDFNIKVFPGAKEYHDRAPKTAPEPAKQSGSNKKTEHTGEKDGVYEVMQSLGLDPDESWLVSL